MWCEAGIGALQIIEVIDLYSFHLTMEWAVVLVLMVPVPLLPARLQMYNFSSKLNKGI